ncbi:response regulator [Desulfurivibrio alkaliphilus]|uniref:Response regulator receiver protein n=1 Tax=Desulfurivibrio alkaliphilus (strain DSM 19089 / UNIQEM U267 / AHT2) TaxID=589865 RepID=D6Z499_DESAT|nr:response regulator [Desulfurivibrio alkaliphilus]ADH86374.1 response regulator receiver protein [Desulfurivibrio alkaliphilus AHT 2]
MAFNILVADDSATMRVVIKKTVEMAGVPVGEFFDAAHGKEAMEILENKWVDVILSDINMPVMGGMELLSTVKQHEEFRHIPVVFITTESSAARMDEARQLGVDGYVKKPFQPETIKSILYDVLEKAFQHKIETPSQPAADDDGMDF